MFAFKKEIAPSFSYRNFSRRAGFSSPNFLKLVIEGKRNLTNASIAKVAKGFSLKKTERDYFENLVFMNQASDHDEKNYYYQKMMSLKTWSIAKKLDQAHYDYFSKWYYPAIRELIMFEDRRLDSSRIASMLNPRVTVQAVEIALKRLTELGLIHKDADGCWAQADNMITTGPEVKSLLITNFHYEMMRLARESIERYPAAERDITALTMSINQKNILELKQKLSEFRKKLLKEYGTDNNPDQVIQINFQMFPLSKVDKKGEKK